MENAFLMKLSNDMEKHEIEVTKIGKNYSIFLQCAPDLFLYKTPTRAKPHIQPGVSYHTSHPSLRKFVY